ncbi:predicted protein [Botrytis cinerea T4]|uniref:Uncharacterized protein n=1 Tax=Botryotinia fuckeliana (strain T4) TaxID=999810 RepID=G2YDW5_BOTF4|nr:predicted protein [Botrytis cinerea T4]
MEFVGQVHPIFPLEYPEFVQNNDGTNFSGYGSWSQGISEEGRRYRWELAKLGVELCSSLSRKYGGSRKVIISWHCLPQSHT